MRHSGKQSESGGAALWEEHSTIPLEVKDLLNDENRTLLEEVSWDQLGKY